ncbi:flagellar basal body-associated FliL family protein [Halalkalibacter okhensis]|uniref:Flagellar protein FliL n=1 Tax=Halalkalibacter okhensis TaxID=333138 RepID=A0A0B0IHS2_9BACI|nr:flagellar basal body-associated FliL family protein [Halalkalibacter okhensis]KHF39629.1 hypothetical protein LQ50_14455 [Halalkalibacter okhensis]
MQKILISILLVLVVGLSSIIYLQNKDHSTNNDLATLEDRIFQTDNMIITIQNSSHLQLAVAIETDSKKSYSELENAYPLIENKMIHSLSSLERQEIQSEDGIERIEATIMASIGSLLTTGEVKNVYLTEKILQ